MLIVRIYSLFVAFTVLSCNYIRTEKDTKHISEDSLIKTSETPSNKAILYTKTYTATSTGKDDLKLIEDSTKIENSDYFEISLYSMGMSNNVTYSAYKVIDVNKSVENYRNVALHITDKDGKNLTFKGSTEFLNYMSQRDYEMVDQVKNKYHTDYTFRKKNK